MTGRRITALTLALILGGLLVSNGRTATAPAADDPTTAELQAEIKQLRDRVAVLETRIERLERRPIIAAPPPARVPVPPDLPRGTIRREINGMSYYIVPTDTTSGRAGDSR